MSPPSPPRRASLLSDDLLQHLIAVGQVDVLVGLPTLDNASTVGPVLLSVHEAIARAFARTRVALLNSDGGSQDGTQDALRSASAGSADLLLASHSLRTMHRVVAPFHGLPGRRTALHTIFAAADLLQARAVAIVDPSTVDPSPDVLAALVREVLDRGADFVGQAPARHPREGPLLTQCVRPMLGALLGASFDDPLGQQFALSGAFVTRALAQPIWDDEPMRAGIDLALHADALAGGFRTAQLQTRTRARVPHPARPGVRETVQQIVRALWVLLGHHEEAWLNGAVAAPPRPVPLETAEAASPPWDATPLERTFREGVHQLDGIWRDLLSPAAVAALESAVLRQPAGLGVDDWTDIVIDFCVAWRTGRFTADQLAGAFVPVYFGRLAEFVRDTEALGPSGAAEHLDRVSRAFATARPALVARWAAARASGEHR